MTARRRGGRHPHQHGNGGDVVPRSLREPREEIVAELPLTDEALVEAPAAVALAVEVVAPATADAAVAAIADVRKASCTLAQLRRFVKSRPYVPLHELRRRFGIEGDDDEVSPVRTDEGTIFVGLPEPEARLLGELVRAGDVGYELLYDPSCPAIVGVYPMRPVARG